MSDHPCAECLNWWECNGVAWDTPDCPAPKTKPPEVALYDTGKEYSGLLEED